MILSEPFTNCINLKSKNCLVIRSVLYSSHDINSFFDRIAIRDLRHFENIFREQNATKTNRASLRCAIFAFCCLLFWRTHTWILTTEAMNSLKHEKENNKIFILLKTNVTLTKSASCVCPRIDNTWRHKMFKLNSFWTSYDVIRVQTTENCTRFVFYNKPKSASEWLCCVTDHVSFVCLRLLLITARNQSETKTLAFCCKNCVL